MMNSFLSFSGTNKGTNTQWSLCGVSSDEIGSTYGESWKVDVVSVMCLGEGEYV